jgi:hypothetical protein
MGKPLGDALCLQHVFPRGLRQASSSGDAIAWHGILAPANTPAPIVIKLHDQTVTTKAEVSVKQCRYAFPHCAINALLSEAGSISPATAPSFKPFFLACAYLARNDSAPFLDASGSGLHDPASFLKLSSSAMHGEQ